MPHPHRSAVFEQALQNFKDKLTTDQQNDFAGTTFKDFQAAMAVVQDRQRLSGTMQNMKRLEGFLTAIEAYSSSMDTFTNVHEIVAFIWGPMKFLLLMARSVAEAFDSLLGAYEKMARYLPLLEDYGIHLDTDTRGERFLEMVFVDIFEFHRLALDLFKKSSWKNLFRTNWSRFQTNFQQLLGNLESNNSLIHKQADLREFANNARERAEAATRFRMQQEDEMLRRRIYLQSWLPAADIETDHERHTKARRGHPDSGRWLFWRREFSEWFRSTNAASSYLWIHGMPGAGKSVLASVVIEEATTRPSSSTLYFYFRHGDAQRSSFLALALSLLQQALQYEEYIVTHLYETATKSGQTSLGSEKKATELLNFCLSMLPAYLILDGLDECPEEEQKKIIHWCDKFMAQPAQLDNSTRCVIFSQNDRTARSLLCNRPTLPITQGDNNSDIHAYCASQAIEISRRFRLSDVKASNLVSKTALSAGGMFLFARLVMEHLQVQETEEDFDNEMNDRNFPKGLDEAYARVLERILGGTSATYKRRTKRLLSWLVCAVRPLKWLEIQTAMSIDSRTQTVDVDRRKLIDDAKSLCGSLIEEGSNGEIFLVHTTAKFYLQDQSHEHCIHSWEAHSDLASLCLDYLNFPIFQPDLMPEKLDMAILKGDFGFVDYSVIHWTQHLQDILLYHTNAGNVSLHELEESLGVFFESRWRDITCTPEIAPSTSQFGVLALRDEDVQSKTAATIAALNHLCTKHTADPITHLPNDTLDMLKTIRIRTEKLAEDPESSERLHRYYGTKLYKCSRVYCKWFHEGFKTSRHRDLHISKHERSHYCTAGGCHRAILGFATKAELDGHMEAYHKPLPSEDDFPESDRETRKRGQIAGQKRVGDNMCHICHKTYSKASNLQTHLRTHDKKRARFACPACDKTFLRPTDLERHESQHIIERRFVCGGKLPSGNSWGCGRQYGRSDILRRHYNSPKGQKCYAPLLSLSASERASATGSAPLPCQSMDIVEQHQFDASQSGVTDVPEQCLHEVQHDGVCVKCGSMDVSVSTPDSAESDSSDDNRLEHPDTMATEVNDEAATGISDDMRREGSDSHVDWARDVDEYGFEIDGDDLWANEDRFGEQDSWPSERNSRPKLLHHDPLHRYLGHAR